MLDNITREMHSQGILAKKLPINGKRTGKSAFFLVVFFFSETNISTSYFS